ncbi:MAG: DUF883 domain-containing protein [Akkermansiaceae bacterium]|nr:DUF883 domain-containing protein [Verrucomicrobiales bacterium]
MDNRSQNFGNDRGTIVGDGKALLDATAELAGQKAGEARKRLTAAMDSGKEIYGRVCEQTVAGAKVADQTIRNNPYQAIGIALSVGALLGYLISRRSSRNSH